MDNHVTKDRLQTADKLSKEHIKPDVIPGYHIQQTFFFITFPYFTSTHSQVFACHNIRTNSVWCCCLTCFVWTCFMFCVDDGSNEQIEHKMSKYCKSCDFTCVQNHVCPCWVHWGIQDIPAGQEWHSVRRHKQHSTVCTTHTLSCQIPRIHSLSGQSQNCVCVFSQTVSELPEREDGEGEESELQMAAPNSWNMPRRWVSCEIFHCFYKSIKNYPNM